MTPEEQRVALIVARWVRIAHEAGYRKEARGSLGSSFPSYSDVLHSALLQRLLDGKEPFPIPPPRSYAYPWYELLENGSADAYEVSPHTRDGAEWLTVNQFIWRVWDRVSDSEYRATYDTPPNAKDSPICRIWKTGEMRHDRAVWRVEEEGRR